MSSLVRLNKTYEEINKKNNEMRGEKNKNKDGGDEDHSPPQLKCTLGEYVKLKRKNRKKKKNECTPESRISSNELKEVFVIIDSDSEDESQSCVVQSESGNIEDDIDEGNMDQGNIDGDKIDEGNKESNMYDNNIDEDNIYDENIDDDRNVNDIFDEFLGDNVEPNTITAESHVTTDNIMTTEDHIPEIPREMNADFNISVGDFTTKDSIGNIDSSTNPTYMLNPGTSSIYGSEGYDETIAYHNESAEQYENEDTDNGYNFLLDLNPERIEEEYQLYLRQEMEQSVEQPLAAPENIVDQETKNMTGQETEDVAGEGTECMTGQETECMAGQQTEDMAGEGTADMSDEEIEDMGEEETPDIQDNDETVSFIPSHKR